MEDPEVMLDPTILDKFEAICNLPVLLPEDHRHSYSIKDIRPGGCIAINTVSYRVLERYRYSDGRYSWFEIKIYNLEDGSVTYLQWEEDDEVGVLIERERFNSLQDVNLSPKKIARMKDEGSGKTSFRGIQYTYDESGNASFFRQEGNPGQKFEYCYLKSQSGQRLGVEKWGDGYSISLSDPVNPVYMQVLHPGNTDDARQTL